MAKKKEVKETNPPAAKKGKTLKNIIIILILLSAAAAIFYIGLVRADLDMDQIGVFYSKTRGYKHKIIYPGQFVWKWEKLLPTNAKILKFTIVPYRAIINRNSDLPSGDIYSIYYEGNPDFSFVFNAEILYQLIPERLPEICAAEKLKPEGVEQWYTDLSGELEEKTISFIQEYASENEGLVSIALGYQGLETALTDYLQETFTSIEVLKIIPRKINFPDVKLYLAARDSYLRLMRAREEAMVTTVRTFSSGEAETEARIAILSQYGEIFSKYPEILEFFSITPESAKKWLPDLSSNETPGSNDGP